MEMKNANVVAMVEPEIKERAEEILANLGMSASEAIGIFYRQVITCNGLPFQPTVSTDGQNKDDELSNAKAKIYDALLKGLSQA